MNPWPLPDRNMLLTPLSFSPILIIDPQLTEQPAEDQFRRLHLVGFFPTKPKAVRFALQFQAVNGGWMIDEISLSVVPLEAFAQQQPPQQQRLPSYTPSADRRAASPAENNPPRPAYR